MTVRTTSQNENVTPFRPRKSARGPQPSRERAAAAQYIAQMTLDLERLATTAHLELVSYFLALARAEAEQAVGSGAATEPEAKDSQAPYQAE